MGVKVCCGVGIGLALMVCLVVCVCGRDTMSGKGVEASKYDEKMKPETEMFESVVWHDPREAPFQLAGFGWWSVDRAYRRMPVNPSEPVPEAVNGLANHTAGGQIRFRTDSQRMAVKVTLAGLAGMPHMPATGQCGFDVYLGEPGQQVYYRTTKYDHTQIDYAFLMFELPSSEMRTVTLNFPLYQGVVSVSVGLEQGVTVTSPPAYDDPRSIVCYGTSITQGGCAARPGMAYSNILSRRINREFINLGFSGSGKGEPEVARTIATLSNPGCFVLDYEANAGGLDGVKATLEQFVGILREAHPTVPILVVSKIRYAAEATNPAVTAARVASRDWQRQTVDRLRAAGDALIFFHDGGTLLGDDFDECTVDGVHPTDLGFLRMADGLEPVIREVLAAGR